jgi:thiol:disulfide interchange protein DsbD
MPASLLRAFLLLSMVAGIATAWGAAPTLSDRAATPHVKAQLVAGADAVQPGEEILLGVRQQIIPHWHTYWKNPGDSGLSTNISWALPAGTTAGEIQWPLPDRFSVGPVTNYGYEDEVTLLAAVRVPESAQVGSRFPVQATVDWLVCREECVPEQVVLALDLPVLAQDDAPGPGHPAVQDALARLPQAALLSAVFSVDEGGLGIRLEDEAFLKTVGQPVNAWFYPETWGRVEHGGVQSFVLERAQLRLRLPPGEVVTAEDLRGVLVLGYADGTRQGFNIKAEAAMVAGGDTRAEKAAGLLPALFMALLGGLILNLMPCVFPVLSIKALSLLQHGGESFAQRRRNRLGGLAYLGGVLASFSILAGILILLKTGGQHLGWGFQFQSPVFVAAVAYLMFAVGLNLSGVFEIGGGAAGWGETLTKRPSYWGSFFTGALAAVVATPCTAPFMGAAIAYALTQSTPALLAVFLSLGLGLALPYLAFCFWPFLQRRLPRPGAWMLKLRQALAFPMYGAAIWLVWVLARQSGANGVLLALGGMLLMALAAWLFGNARQAQPGWRGLGTGAALATLLLVGFTLAPGNWRQGGSANSQEDNLWEPYASARLEALLSEGKPVFVNLTAAWCITCLANERVALNQPEVQDAFRQAGVTCLKGDWTNQDAEIAALLARYGRNGVPLYLYYPRGKFAPARVLPQLLTPTIVVQALSSESATSF